ncbi:DJ-1/PfpI family protein [Halogranum rubrum]|uniref:Transcriptional regulator n=1 Tax=Halogranum salarium B-1 TaxID=1210908 RepID=J3EVW2_9EURY|nr:DJ-1/PfpI family protein [Halogranum salarium]EJN58857.1 transcriptional regulator [Halogranum salarium B-1]
MTAIDILLYDGFDELDAIAPYEVFQNAAALDADFSVRLVTLDDRTQVTASHGLRVEPDGRLDLDDRPDVLVVPGGGWNSRSEAGAWAEAERGVVPDAVATLHDSGVTVASVCTGGMLLARAGLTDGRPAVTHASAVDDLRDSGADVVDARVVDDGDLLTAGGVTSGLDLALHLVDRLAGSAIADRVATEIEYERRFEVHEETK